MTKMVVLKPVVWNDNGYVGPAGLAASSGFSFDHGYGHEEWNGRSDWVWKGWKVFHTQPKGRMHQYAEDGQLGIIMTAMNEGKFYAVGIACNVYENSTQDSADIAKALGLSNYKDDLWKVESIRKRKLSRADFDRHWQMHLGVQWRCPQTHYAWFGTPLQIFPNELIPANPPRQAIVKMHGSYQAIRPDQALSIAQSALAPDHSVIGWLSTEDFDSVQNSKVRNAQPPQGKHRGSASTPADPYIRYIAENEMVVTPRHYLLQNDFKAYLLKHGNSDVKPDIMRVDVRYKNETRGNVLAEIKPTEKFSIRFAIRTAIGQLLDYRQNAEGPHALLVVIDDEPIERDAELALSNGFGIAWRSGKDFVIRWPNEC
jgi:hypothetical protein